MQIGRKCQLFYPLAINFSLKSLKTVQGRRGLHVSFLTAGLHPWAKFRGHSLNGLLLATSLLPKLETPAITDRQGFVHCYASWCQVDDGIESPPRWNCVFKHRVNIINGCLAKWTLVKQAFKVNNLVTLKGLLEIISVVHHFSYRH